MGTGIQKYIQIYGISPINFGSENIVVPVVIGNNRNPIRLHSYTIDELSNVSYKINTNGLFPFPVKLLFSYGSFSADLSTFYESNGVVYAKPGDNIYESVSIVTYDSTKADYVQDPNFYILPLSSDVSRSERFIVYNIDAIGTNEKYIHFSLNKNNSFSAIQSHFVFNENPVTYYALYSKNLGFGSDYSFDLSAPDGKKDFPISIFSVLLYNNNDNHSFDLDSNIYYKVDDNFDDYPRVTDIYVGISSILEKILNDGGGHYTARFYYNHGNFTSYFDVSFNIFKDIAEPISGVYSSANNTLVLSGVDASYGLAVKVTDTSGNTHVLEFFDSNTSSCDYEPDSLSLIIEWKRKGNDGNYVNNSIWNDTSDYFYKIDESITDHITIPITLNLSIFDDPINLEKPNLTFTLLDGTLSFVVNNLPESVNLEYSDDDGTNWNSVTLVDNKGMISPYNNETLLFRYFDSLHTLYSDTLTYTPYGSSENLLQIEKKHIGIADMLINSYDYVNNFFVYWDFDLNKNFNGMKIHIYGDKVDELDKYIAFDGVHNIKLDTDEFYFNGKNSTIKGDFKKARLTLASDKKFEGYIRSVFIEWI